jgi:hypothetical protein
MKKFLMGGYASWIFFTGYFSHGFVGYLIEVAKPFGVLVGFLLLVSIATLLVVGLGYLNNNFMLVEKIKDKKEEGSEDIYEYKGDDKK